VPGQVRDQPRGDGVELTHVPEPGAAQQRPNVDGAYARANNRPMPPCRSGCMSSMLSAPATIPATSEATFKPGCATIKIIGESGSSTLVPLEPQTVEGPV
jgi:hypothetical protein